jgi:G3E family GTPase
VNEFGKVGIDGRILAHSGTATATVVEMPSGCICCTLAPDFRRQIIEVSATYAPDRLIIEPTGLATIGQIMVILAKDDVQPLYTGIRLIHVVDGSEMLAFIKANRRFVENQIRASHLVILNKTDLLKPSRVNLLVASIREINPAAQVYPTSFARLAPDVLSELFDVRRASAERLPEMDTTIAGENDYESFGRRYRSEVFHPERLHALFEQLPTQCYGDVVRAKGIFRTDREWLLLELASGAVQRSPGPAGAESTVSIIGQQLNNADLDAQLQRCVIIQKITET